jgi:PhnB protein
MRHCVGISPSIEETAAVSTYTDVYVIPVPQAKAGQYRELAETSAKVWREAGALSYVEVEADDVKSGQWTSFPQSVKLEDGETVVVAIVTFSSRAHRDAVNAKAMADPRMTGMDPKTMPFDGKRLFWGGFKPLAGGAEPARVQPYLFFRGRCEEAIRFYEKSLGAEVVMMMRFSENPDAPPPDKVPAELARRIMHASLRIAGTEIMMSDGMKSGPLDFSCMSLSLSVASEAECDRIFQALAADGTVEMPLGPTFFAKRFGAVIDTFGVAWMIILPLEA